MTSFIMINGGPDVEGSEIVHEFKLNEYDEFDTWMVCNDRNEYFFVLEYENIGPFESKEKAFEGLAIHFYKLNERIRKLLREISELAESD